MDTLPKLIKSKRVNRSIPHLPVKNLRSTLDYYRDKLGFSDEWTLSDKDDGIRRNDLHLLFAEENDFTNDKSNHICLLLWFVDEIDVNYAEFKNRDIALADKLRTPPYGLREFAFIDINSDLIRITENSVE